MFENCHVFHGSKSIPYIINNDVKSNNQILSTPYSYFPNKKYLIHSNLIEENNENSIIESNLPIKIKVGKKIEELIVNKGVNIEIFSKEFCKRKNLNFEAVNLMEKYIKNKIGKKNVVKSKIYEKNNNEKNCYLTPNKKDNVILTQRKLNKSIYSNNGNFSILLIK